MTLPTTSTAINAGTAADHVNWHNEIDTLVPFLGLPTVSIATTTGHLAAHEALHAFVGGATGSLPLDVSEGQAGHRTHHLAIHQYLTSTPVTNLTTASDVQAALTAGANGAVFGLAAGTYRITTALAPKTDQTVYGAYGAVLNGAQLLTSWTASGSDWWATRAAGAIGSQPDDIRCAVTGCDNPHDVFYDGAPLVRVASQGALAAGKFYEDFAAGRVYIRDLPTGHTVEQAISNRLVHSSSSGVHVRNFVVQFSANRGQQAAIEADGANWVIEQNDVRYNHGHGVGTNGDGSVVRRNLIHHQMQMGIGGEGEDVLVEYNEIHHNNRDNSYAWGWEAGGSKWAFSQRLTVRGNWVHHDNGPGLWADINNGNVVFEDNYVHDSLAYGIFYEISYGEVTLGDGLKTHIRRNVSFDNNPTSTTGFYTGGQIIVSGSRDCEVYQNVTRGQDGIGGLAQLRTDSPDGRGSHQVHNLHVYNNDMQLVWDGSGFANLAGIQTDDPAQTNGVYTGQGNTFEGNRYYVPLSTQSYWTWINDFESWAGWQALGNDDTAGGGSRTVGGTVTIPAAPVLSAGPRGPLP